MKKILILSALFFWLSPNVHQAQNEPPEVALTQADIEAHMRFLASDELRGRRTGEPGNNIAARYIAAHFEAFGLKKAPGLKSYYQTFYIEKTSPPQNANLTIDGEDYEFGKDFLILGGDAIDVKTEAVFAGHGWVDDESDRNDYEGLDVEGKVVFVLPGTEEGQDRREAIISGAAKRKIAAELGAAALIELYRIEQFPWNFFRRSYARERLQVIGGEPSDNESKLVYGFFKEPSPNPITKLQEGKTMTVSLKTEAANSEVLPTQNVIGIVEGTDPELKDEYVLLTAHYDHVGVGKQGGGSFSARDSIFNGARDNAMGTVAVLAAAEALAQAPPKRSIIFLPVTGEEVGLLGSRYYADNPVIPLEKIIFNFNVDTGGYNNTKVVGIVGHGRTGTDDIVDAGLKPFGLRVKANPAPEQGLFDRSDNVAFARKGVPCLTFTPGFDEFDEEIMKYYHQVADNQDTIDY